MRLSEGKLASAKGFANESRLKQKSLSISKIPQAYNNWKILERCKESSFIKQILGAI